ncbi:hypothetical protein AVEN_153825-1 [Araneus ventricosus]|uniref:Uncharacterized protein n=1 Tax=Araneus ventricosus TaxID=182803 RepID=A0A4Y2WWT3_ARAVE|nr:hypothetical protein AVEN_117530-1 [Araneus ventricosus]GBO41463.1 hypothetical protein AVEN_6774-1 [Araneus ventricosus]GBO41465.1 hypothetical protein AVEN_153825-1 [Araneus ventricosus]
MSTRYFIPCNLHTSDNSEYIEAITITLDISWRPSIQAQSLQSLQKKFTENTNHFEAINIDNLLATVYGGRKFFRDHQESEPYEYQSQSSAKNTVAKNKKIYFLLR